MDGSMVQFDQWLGFIVICLIWLAGFWIFVFLLNILPYWIWGHYKDLYKRKKAEKNKKLEA